MCVLLSPPIQQTVSFLPLKFTTRLLKSANLCHGGGLGGGGEGSWESQLETYYTHIN